MKIHEENFIYEHKRRPRGSGHWQFFFDENTQPLVCIGEYSEAKKLARKYARAQGFKECALGIRLKSEPLS
jgi:hypothetical protein